MNLMKSLLLLSAFVTGMLFSQSAQEIVTKSESLLKGETSKGKFRMTIVTQEYTRTMEMDSWWVGNEKALIVVTSPRREAGNKTLKVENELWMYLRNTETTIKVPPSMMLQSWNGSDFTNDDLVRESSLVDDYILKTLGEERVGSETAWKIELQPKPTAPVVWGRIVHWIRKQDYLPARTEYYDEKGTLVRTMEYSDFREFDGRRIPATWRMINNVKPGRETRFEYLTVDFNVKISDRIFSFQELEKGGGR
ncbi:MAG: outer membrane lipoprotein-sorting protein [Ignavibacteriales bacterium]|nr:outer membrane lipoprotein-sorting protein [Ignavibacteriales bacterium]